jgi:hypothetical protein
MSSQVENPEDTSSPNENSTERLESLEMEIPRHPPEVEFDAVDVDELLSEAYYLLGQVVGLRMKAQLRTDIIRLKDKIEEGLCFYKHN